MSAEQHGCPGVIFAGVLAELQRVHDTAPYESLKRAAAFSVELIKTGEQAEFTKDAGNLVCKLTCQRCQGTAVATGDEAHITQIVRPSECDMPVGEAVNLTDLTRNFLDFPLGYKGTGPIPVVPAMPAE